MSKEADSKKIPDDSKKKTKTPLSFSLESSISCGCSGYRAKIYIFSKFMDDAPGDVTSFLYSDSGFIDMAKYMRHAGILYKDIQTGEMFVIEVTNALKTFPYGKVVITKATDEYLSKMQRIVFVGHCDVDMENVRKISVKWMVKHPYYIPFVYTCRQSTDYIAANLISCKTYVYKKRSIVDELTRLYVL